MHRNINEVVKQPTLWVSILGLMNPVTFSIGVAGLVAYAVIKSASKTSQKERLLTVAEPLSKPMSSGSRTVKSTVRATAGNGDFNGSNTPEILDDEALKKEMIRRTMSELGKRSGAARAKKRDSYIRSE